MDIKLMKTELKLYREDLESEDIESLFSVKVTNENGRLPITVTSMTTKNISKEDKERISILLWKIGKIVNPK